MYCVIQELKLKKANTLGAYRQLAVMTNPFNIRKDVAQYGYCDAGEQFERPIKLAYKISVHESKRVNGVVTKKQFVVTTVDYYTLASGFFTLGDYADRIEPISEKLNVDAGAVYDLLEAKIALLEERIRAEFELTEEFVVSAKHEAIIARYREAKAEFAKKHKCPEGEYDFCFNVFGELMDANYLEIIAKGAAVGV